MNIECSHCGAVNRADSTFCGECGWQIMPREAEEKIERIIASLQKKADRDDVKPRPEAKPAVSDADLRPEVTIASLEPASGQEDLEARPIEDLADSEAELERESGQGDLEHLPGEEPVDSIEDLEAETIVIRVESGEGQEDTEDLIEDEPVGDKVGLEPEPFVGAPGSGGDAAFEPTAEAVSSRDVVFFEDGEGVMLTSSAVVFEDRTYAWSEIVSSSVETLPATRWPSLLLAALGAALMAFAVASMGHSSGLGLILIAGGLALLAIGLLLTATARAQHLVRMETLSGVETALVSSDLEHVERILLALRGGPDGHNLTRED